MNPNRLTGMFFLGLVIHASSFAAMRTDISPAMALKTTPAVIEKATNGVVQDLIVEFDAADVLSSEARMLKSIREARPQGSQRDLKTLSEQHELVEQTAKYLQKLKENTFVGGWLGSAHVKKSYTHLPLALVTVPDLESLKLILIDIHITRVSENETAHVQGTQNFTLIGQPTAVSAGVQGGSTRVAVIDSGFDISSAAFSFVQNYPACRLSSNSESAADVVGTGNCRIQNALNFVTPTFDFCTYCDNFDQFGNGHGAGVATVIANMAPLTKIAALQVFNPSGVANVSDIIDALNWVASNASTSPPIVAVNLSFNIGASLYSTKCSGDPMATVMNRLLTLNVIPVAATGNSANVFAVGSPACIPGVVAVGAVADSSTPPATYGNVCKDGALVADQVPCFSNGGSLVTLLAPGVAINAGPSAMSGTSLAAPHVSGAIALLRGAMAYPSETASQTIQRMVSTGKSVRDQRYMGSTTPRLQIDAALGMRRRNPPPPNCSANPQLCH